MFELHPQLAKDTMALGQFKLSLVLLHKDATYPWVVLVPKRPLTREIHHLSHDDQVQLIRESSHLSEVMTSIFAPTTMNIASLGNSIPQLHVHHVARYETDPVWPRAVWGATTATDYDPEKLTLRVQRLVTSLEGEGFEAFDGVIDDPLSAEGFTP